MDGTRRHGGGDRARDRGGVRRQRVQQHHGPVAARLRIRECASLRDVFARYVLETDDGPRGVHGTALRHVRRRGPSRPYAPSWGERRHQGWVSRGGPHLSE